MLLTVGELREKVQYALPSLVKELVELTGRGGDNERHAWQRSLPRLADALSSDSLARIHVHFQRREHHVALEYQLPGTASTCDVVLLGKHRDRNAAIVIELKDWETNQDRPGVAEGLIERRGIQELHPSDQVRGYVEYCRHFHSTVLEKQANVHGLVLFTTGLLKHPYTAIPNKTLTDEFPVFTMAREDIDQRIPKYFADRLTEADATFATAFATGSFEQDRGFMKQIAQQILSGDTRQFELLDNQRRAFSLTMATIRAVMEDKDASRRVVLVEGPPGSGKTAVAAKIWASLVTDPSVPQGNICLVTTSQSQNSNWVHLIERASARRAGRGVARKATSFTPLSIPQLSRLRKEVGDENLYKNAAEWRSHLSDLQARGIAPVPGAESDSMLITLVDEAHGLITPEKEFGVGQYGFVTGLGPQAYHIIRCSRLSVFFIDPEQSFRARENTRVEDIVSWATELGAIVDTVSLAGAQFRCAGSAEYVSWVESLLSGASAELNRVFASAWYETASATAAPRSGNVLPFPSRSLREREAEEYRVAEATGGYVVPRLARRASLDFRVFDNPFQMEQELRALHPRHVVRLLSSYSRKWKTEGSSYPHQLPSEGQDFYEFVTLPDGRKKAWSRVWNFVPGGDYTGFVSGRVGTPIHDDPLCEVGCTYAVRGFDFDYVGLLWLSDLRWRNGHWEVPLDCVHESGIAQLVRQARREGPVAPTGPKGANVLEKVKQAYRILLTRAIKGVFVWIPDEETREHVVRSMRL